MPLSTKRIEQINQIFKLEPTPENLGPIMRRACAFTPNKYDEWEDRLDLIDELMLELKKYSPDEISKINKQGKSALHYAIHGLMDYAAANDDPNQIYYHLQLIYVICNFYPRESLEIDIFVKQYSSDKYKNDNADQFYMDALILGFDKLPTVDVCIKAVEFILATMHTGLLIRELEQKSEDRASIKPIVIISSHIDMGVVDFFTNYLGTLAKNNYGLVCPELPSGLSSDQYLATNSSVQYFKTLQLKSNLQQQKQIDIHKHVINETEKNKLAIQFIDCTPPSQIQESIINSYIIEKYNILAFMNYIRNEAMAKAVKLASLKNNTDAIMIIGTNHYEGIKHWFDKMRIDAKYLIVTEGASFDQKQIFIALLEKAHGAVSLIDFSKQPKRAEVLGVLGITSNSISLKS